MIVVYKSKGGWQMCFRNELLNKSYSGPWSHKYMERWWRVLHMPNNHFQGTRFTRAVKGTK